MDSGARKTHSIGLVLVVTISVVAGLAAVSVNVKSATKDHTLTVSAGAANNPSVSAVTLNGGSPIILIANATQTVYVNFTVSDNDGCADVFTNGNVTTTIYRSGVSTTCAAANPGSSNLNTLNCYLIATTTNNCSGGSSANATATFEVYYFAQATDASSSYPDEGWQAFIEARDASNATSASSSAAVEMNTLAALHVATTTINYGSMSPNTDTGSTNQLATVKNAGNSSTTLRLHGTAMVSGSNSISTSSQHYATSSFTYGGAEQALQEAATDVAGFLVSRPVMTTWTTTTALPTALGYFPSVTNNNYIYRLGGDLDTVNRTSSVQYAFINATGSLDSWVTTTPFPTTRWDFPAIVNNGYIVAIGGFAASLRTSSVLYALMNATGSLESWATTTPLPTAISSFPAVANNGYVYVLGGTTGTATATVLYAPMNATGSLGTWATTTPLPNTRTFFPAVAHNGYLYALGGVSGSRTSTVLFALINATGSLGSWASTTPLPVSLEGHGAVANSGILYVLGGTTGSVTSTVYFAHVNTNGTIGNWSRTSAMPVTHPYLAATENNGYLYRLGGQNAGVSTNNVSFVPVASRNTYWGLAVPNGTPTGTYTGTNFFTAVFSP
jgi:N-acetylneuraminic acid mutarotase